MDYLDIDLNEIATKAIRKEISSLESTIKRLKKENTELCSTKNGLKKELTSAENFSFISASIVAQWAECKSVPEKCEYIEKIMLWVFGIKKSYSFYDDRGGLLRNLAINYYHHKEELISIVTLLDIKHSSYSSTTGSFIDSIKAFIMPCDWDKNKILAYVKSPHYCTNGCVYGPSQFYFENDRNVTHDLIQANKHIIDPDVFDEVINTIEKKSGEYNYLYTIPKYNTAISRDQIKRLGRTLIGKKGKFYDITGEFVKKNMSIFDKETLEYLYLLTSHDNEYRLFHWQNFPIEYQQRYLKERPILKILHIILDHNCKWTDEQKEEFLQKYYGSSEATNQHC